jgi:outer membrane receptor protein involved in Fe transport
MTVDGIQSNIFVGTGFNLVNVEEQTHKGLEIDSLFYITPDFSLTFSASLIDAEYGSFEKGPCDGTLSPPKEDDCPFVNGVLSRFQDFTGRTPAGILVTGVNSNVGGDLDLGNFVFE